jgi:voltage-gated potassium channel
VRRGKSPVAVERDGVQDHAARWERRFSLPVIVAALATVPLLIVDESHPGQPWRGVVDVGDWVVWLVFAAELVVMLAMSRGARVRYLRDHPLEVAIVVLTPPFLSLAVQSIRVARVLRVLRLLRLGPAVRRMLALEALRYASLLALLALVGGAEAFASAERVSVGDALYWALSTMTTVGYGDITPRTVEGKVIASVLMLVGIGFFAVITAAIAQRFLAGEVEEAVGELSGAEADVIAQIRALAEQLARLEAAVRRQALGPEIQGGSD